MEKVILGLIEVKNSSSVIGVAYSDGELFVKFTAGVIYKYTNVPEDVFTDIVKLVTLGNVGTKSPVGKFIQDHIKGNFEFEKVMQPSGKYEFCTGEELWQNVANVSKAD